MPMSFHTCQRVNRSQDGTRTIHKQKTLGRADSRLGFIDKTKTAVLATPRGEDQICGRQSECT